MAGAVAGRGRETSSGRLVRKKRLFPAVSGVGGSDGGQYDNDAGRRKALRMLGQRRAAGEPGGCSALHVGCCRQRRGAAGCFQPRQMLASLLDLW